MQQLVLLYPQCWEMNNVFDLSVQQSVTQSDRQLVNPFVMVFLFCTELSDTLQYLEHNVLMCILPGNNDSAIFRENFGPY